MLKPPPFETSRSLQDGSHLNPCDGRSRVARIFTALSGFPVVHDYELAFSEATGLPLKLLSNDSPPAPVPYRASGNPFCAALGGIPQGCALCAREHASVRRLAAETHESHRNSCFAGMIDVAVPVMIDGVVVATLFAGQVTLKKPTVRRFDRIARQLRDCGVEDDLTGLRRTYLGSRVISERELDAMLRLLRIFAAHLAHDASRCLIQHGESDPPGVALAKDFAQHHAAEPIAMPDAARHAHLSPCYFCKIFKRSTGITFTEYVCRIRVETAKRLLGDACRRVSEIAADSGFESIPHFNRVFRRYAGMAPTQYRASLSGVPDSKIPSMKRYDES